MTQKVLLLVDDEPDILESYQHLLEISIPDLRVVTASSAAQGVKALEASHIDLILSDYKMPGTDGIAFLADCARRWPEIPRILITAFPEPISEIEGDARSRAGISGFLSKAAPVETIIRAVQSALAL